MFKKARVSLPTSLKPNLNYAPLASYATETLPYSTIKPIFCQTQFAIRHTTLLSHWLK